MYTNKIKPYSFSLVFVLNPGKNLLCILALVKSGTPTVVELKDQASQREMIRKIAEVCTINLSFSRIITGMHTSNTIQLPFYPDDLCLGVSPGLSEEWSKFVVSSPSLLSIIFLLI